MLKYCLTLLTITLFFAACSNDEQAHRIKSLADVRLPDPEKEAIIKNHIRDVYGFDTADFFARYPKARKYYGKLPPGSGIDSFARPILGYLIEVATYDSSANRKYHLLKTTPHLFCSTGIYPEFGYDSLGYMTWQGKRGIAIDSFAYYVLPGKNILLSVHRRLTEKNRLPDTTRYHLENNGRPLMSEGHGDVTDTTWYTYNADGKISMTDQNVLFINNNNVLTLRRHFITRHYYYHKNGNLDSMISYYKSLEGYPGIRSEKRYYDEDGLIQSGLVADTLHVYYIRRRFSDKNEHLY